MHCVCVRVRMHERACVCVVYVVYVVCGMVCVWCARARVRACVCVVISILKMLISYLYASSCIEQRNYCFSNFGRSSA